LTGEASRARFDELRGLVAENDRRLVAGVNERLRLVGELWRLKGQLGLPLFDADREERLRTALAAVNQGPLSAEGLDRLVDELLALTRSELGAPEPPPS
jgi:chorismate mutase